MMSTNIKDLIYQTRDNFDRSLVIDTKKKLNSELNENTKLKTTIRMLEADILEKNRAFQKLFNEPGLKLEDLDDATIARLKTKFSERNSSDKSSPLF